MSEADPRQTKSRVSLCDETVDVEARIACRDDADALIERIRLAADWMWPEEARIVVNDAAVAAAIAKIGDGEPAPSSDDPAEKPLSVAEAIALAKKGPLAAEVVERVVAEQLADDEFENLSPAQAEAVALKRLGLSAMQIAGALGAPSEQSIWARLSKAKDKGVIVERECAA